MTSKIEQAQQRIGALEAEQAALRAAAGQLEEQIGQQDRALDALYAAAEREPSAANSKAAAAAEGQIGELKAQLRRKRAALEACAADLEQARGELKRAQALGVHAELAECVARAGQIAGELNKNLLQPALWGELARLWRQSANLQMRLGDASIHRGLFVDPKHARDQLLAEFVKASDWAIDHPEARPAGPDLSVSGALRLEQAEGRLRALQP